MPQRHSFPKPRHSNEDGGYAPSDPAFIIWECPRCSWYRIRTNREMWERTIIPHPLYGNISNYDAYMFDVANHDCDATKAARLKYGISTVRRFNGTYNPEPEKSSTE